jgi:hypothetical protein
MVKMGFELAASEKSVVGRNGPKIENAVALVRIPDDADQRSGMMPITIPF